MRTTLSLLSALFLLIAILFLGLNDIRAQDQSKPKEFNNNQSSADSAFSQANFKAMYDIAIGAVIESKLDYFESSDAIEKLARLNKRYYDALIKEGFTEQQAMAIVLEVPLLTTNGGEFK